MRAEVAYRSRSVQESVRADPEQLGVSAAHSHALTLFRFGPFLGAPDSSPFVIKVMMLLKLARLPFGDVQGNPLKAPKKLLPYIEDEGAIVADSSLIRLHIERK